MIRMSCNHGINILTCSTLSTSMISRMTSMICIDTWKHTKNCSSINCSISMLRIYKFIHTFKTQTTPTWEKIRIQICTIYNIMTTIRHISVCYYCISMSSIDWCFVVYVYMMMGTQSSPRNSCSSNYSPSCQYSEKIWTWRLLWQKHRL